MQTDLFPGEHVPRLDKSLLHPRYWLLWLGLLTLYIVSWLPRPLRHLVADLSGLVSCVISSKRRRVAMTNIALCFPDLSVSAQKRLVRDHFRYRMRAFLDYSILWWGSRQRIARLVRLDGVEEFQQLAEAGTPVILSVPHSTSLDFGPALMTQTWSTYGMAKPARNRLVDWVLQRGRARFKTRLHMRNSGLRDFLRTANRTDSLFYLPDEDFGPKHSVFAPFFRQPKASLTTLGRMARITGARVIPAMTWYSRLEGRYVMSFLPALSAFPSSDEIQNATSMNKAIEQLVLLAPEQYLWTMKLFKTRPEGYKTLY